MSGFSLRHSVRHLRRYREIARVFLKRGFGFAFDYLAPE